MSIVRRLLPFLRIWTFCRTCSWVSEGLAFSLVANAESGTGNLGCRDTGDEACRWCGDDAAEGSRAETEGPEDIFD